MARLSTTDTYTGTPSAGAHGDALRTHLNTNLAQWAIGAVTTFTSGAVVRKYFTGTHAGSSMEFMFYVAEVAAGNTLAAGIHSSYQSGDPFSVNDLGTISVSIAPTGGFQASLTAGNDPVNANFWSHLTDNGKVQASKVFRVSDWTSVVATSHVIVTVEDNIGTNAFLAIYTYRNGSIGTNTASAHIIASNLFDSTGLETSGVDQIRGQGMIWIDMSAVAKPKVVSNFRIVYWNQSTGLYNQDSTNLSTSYSLSKDPVSGAYPAHTTFPAFKVPLMTTTRIPARVNSSQLLFVPENISLPTVKLGNDTDYRFVQICKGYALPWDNNQAVPT